MAISAVRAYLAHDLAKYELRRSEQRFDLPLTLYTPAGQPVVFTLYGTPDIEMVEDHIIDWKSAGSLTPELVETYSRSWQGKTYMYATGAKSFEYRILERPPMDFRTTRCRYKSIVLFRPENLAKEVENYYAGVAAEMSALRQGQFTIYPAKKPFACGVYGRKCPYYDDCPSHPQALPLMLEINNSGAESFLLCNERYRRGQLIYQEGGDPEGGHATRFGTAFHAIMAEIYRQAYMREEVVMKQ